MKTIIAASGLGRVHRDCERFFADLARPLCGAGAEVACWGGATAPGIEGLPVASREALYVFAQNQVTAAGAPTATAEELRQWSGDAEEYLFGFSAARALNAALAASDRVLLYLRYWQLAIHGGNPSLIRACLQGIGAGRLSVVVHGDHVYPDLARTLQPALDAFAERQAERFGWNRLAPRYAADFAALAARRQPAARRAA